MNNDFNEEFWKSVNDLVADIEAGTEKLPAQDAGGTLTEAEPEAGRTNEFPAETAAKAPAAVTAERKTQEKTAPPREAAAEKPEDASRERFCRNFSRYTITLLIIAAAGLTLFYLCAAMFDRMYAGLGDDLSAVKAETMAVAAAPTPVPTPEPAPEPTPEPTPEPAPEPVKIPCDEETRARLASFADVFIDNYYNYFGTRNADYYYGELLGLVAEGSELRERMDASYWDHEWINTGYNTIANKSLDDAYISEDGTYTVECSLDITEQAAYWTYNDHLTLKIFCIADENSAYGFRAIATE